MRHGRAPLIEPRARRTRKAVNRRIGRASLVFVCLTLCVVCCVSASSTIDDPFRSGYISMHVFPLHGGGSELCVEYHWLLSAAAPAPMVAGLQAAVPRVGETHVNNFVAVIEKEQGGLAPSTLLTHDERISVRATPQQLFRCLEDFTTHPDKYLGASELEILENTPQHVKRSDARAAHAAQQALQEGGALEGELGPSADSLAVCTC